MSDIDCKSSNGSLVSHKINVGGESNIDFNDILSIKVEQSLNRISTAQIVILDGSANEGTFAVSASDTFVPGKSIEIKTGYDSNEKPIFSGIIISQQIGVEDDGAAKLTIECKDQAVKLTIGRKSGIYTGVTDTQVMQRLVDGYSGVQAKIAKTTKKHLQLVQYYCSDWDFMLIRAEANSLLVSNKNNEINIFRPGENTKSLFTVTYGDNLHSFSAQMNTVTQFAKVKATAWDHQKQKTLSCEVSKTVKKVKAPGNIDSNKLAEVVKLDQFELQSAAALDQGDLNIWAGAQKLKSEYGKITAEVRIQGNAVIECGKYITLAGVGGRFNGDHLVSGVCHEISQGDWFVTATLGLSADWFVQEPDIMAPPASGLLPGVQGLQSGTVIKIDSGDKNDFRILVDLPLMGGKKQGVWSRLANFYSTKGAGAFFMPEIDDEVIVGFLNEDPRYPVVLGSLYSKTIKPHSTLKPNAKNSHKAIVSKSELRIVFDDESKVLSLTTPNGNQVEFDDKNKRIKLADQHKNTVILAGTGIELKSSGDIKIMAGEKVVIQGSKGVVIKSPAGDVMSSGLNIKETASMSFIAKGNASATVKGGGKLTLKAGLVTIN